MSGDQRVSRRWRVVFNTPIGVLHVEHQRTEYPNIRVPLSQVAYSAAVEATRWIAESMAEGVNEQSRHNLVHALVDDPDNYTVKELTLHMEWIE